MQSVFAGKTGKEAAFGGPIYLALIEPVEFTNGCNVGNATLTAVIVALYAFAVAPAFSFSCRNGVRCSEHFTNDSSFAGKNGLSFSALWNFVKL